MADVPTLTLEEEVYGAQLNMALQLLYNPVLCLVKESIMVFLWRLEDYRPFIRWSIVTLFFFNLGHMFAVFFAGLASCQPIDMYWNHYYTDEVVDGEVVNPNYTCNNEEAFILSTAALAILTDVLVLAIPIAMLWPLKINIRKKLAIGVVLSLGWLVAVIGVIRLWLFWETYHVVRDEPFYSIGSTVSGIEGNVAIILCCVPAINAIISKFAPRIFGTRTGTRPTGESTYNSHGFEMPESRRYTIPISVRGGARQDPMDTDNDSQEEFMIHDSLGAKRAGVVVGKR